MPWSRRSWLPCLAAALFASGAFAATAPKKSKPVHGDREPDHVSYGRRDDVQRFAAELAESRGLDRAWVAAALGEARYVPKVAQLMMPPPVGVAKNWAAYRARFIEPERIAAGAAFWAAQAVWLEMAELRFGVPAEIVIGIIGVETFYGRVMGNFRVLDALATLSFDFPRGRTDRSQFFRGELGQFLVLAQREGVPPNSIKGSYAGAVGLGQFMPGSILEHAVDFDEDGHIDMAHSAADVIGSIANYLAESGWIPGQPTHYPVLPPQDTAERAALLLPDILPSFMPSEMAGHGARLDDAALAHPGPLALVELENGHAANSYVAGTQNFYAVTRYNRSSYYAMAVIELGRAVAAWRQARR
ncbi:MAG: lytic murein transglycosylase B [Burkholderiales bacterium]|nr:lytic murein transglycosylase B [Burkholderiales bacterium]